MPNLTTITLVDREQTPVSHTYTPTTRENGVSEFREADGVPIGDNKITVSLRKTDSGLYKARLKFLDPVVVTETINSVSTPKVARMASANIEFVFSEESTLQERKNIVGKVADALASDQSFLMAVLQELEGIY